MANLQISCHVLRVDFHFSDFHMIQRLVQKSPMSNEPMNNYFSLKTTYIFGFRLNLNPGSQDG